MRKEACRKRNNNEKGREVKKFHSFLIKLSFSTGLHDSESFLFFSFYTCHEQLTTLEDFFYIEGEKRHTASDVINSLKFKLYWTGINVNAHLKTWKMKIESNRANVTRCFLYVYSGAPWFSFSLFFPLLTWINNWGSNRKRRSLLIACKNQWIMKWATTRPPHTTSIFNTNPTPMLVIFFSFALLYIER